MLISFLPRAVTHCNFCQNMVLFIYVGREERDMKISELNKQQRALINGSFHNEVEFDWEDDELLEVLLGNLPKIRLNCKEQESRKFVYEIESLYKSYSFFDTNKEEFLKKIKENILTSV